MQHQLFLLKLELANTSVKVKTQQHQSIGNPDYKIHVTFNGYPTTGQYQDHLRQFYDQFKGALEQSLLENSILFDRYELLESIRIHLIECEKLSCNQPLYDYDVESHFPENKDVRLEADLKYQFAKK